MPRFAETNAGVGAEHVDLAAALICERDQILHVRLAGDIQTRCNSTNFGCHLLHERFVHIGDHNSGRTFRGETPAQRCADILRDISSDPVKNLPTTSP